MSVRAEQSQPLIPQTGAAAIWRVDFSSSSELDEADAETCEMHEWTCIWCSMTPPICGSCRPVTPPCPANGGIHTCACRERQHAREAA